ncbi:MAG: nucleotide exchange factor GrpE [Pseudonocardiaceae bacterium]
MRPDDGSDDATAEPHRDPAPATQPAVRPDENGHAAGEPAGVPALPLPTELGFRLAAIETTLAELAARFASESDRALARERVIDRQHAEIERLKSVERAGQLRPVVTDLCRLRNGLLRQAETVPDGMTGPRIASLLDSFAATAAEALERCGVAVLPREVGTVFAPSRQQVAAIVEIDDPERDGTVAEIVQDGYAEIDGGKVVIPARVRLNRYVTEDRADG